VFKLLILAISLGVYLLFKSIVPNLDFESLHKKVMLIVVVCLTSLLIFVTFKYGM
jgi:EamA domain-containing membrane protein RarD